VPQQARGVQLGSCVTDIVGIAALRARARDLERIARSAGLRLPALGHSAVTADHMALCVRPGRWLILSPPASPGANAGRWQAACAGVGAAVDLSSGLTALHFAGAAAREVLVRSCRLDLDPDAFPPGAAAATMMVQVSVMLAALPSGVLLLTPSSTARHVREWLLHTAQPFGVMPSLEVNLADLCGAQSS
jgi:sarcosine oxidase subunit gamma